MTTGIINAEGKPENGEAIKFEVHIVYDPLTGHLDMQAHVPNHDVLMNILQQAERALDIQMRVAAGIAAQQAINKDKAILQLIQKQNG